MAPFDGTSFKDYAAPETREVPEIFSVEGLRDFCRTKLADAEYCFLDNGGCLLHQYYSHRGLPVKNVLGFGAWRDTDNVVHGSMVAFEEPWQKTIGRIAGITPHTFGAALSRCEAYLTPQGR